MSDGKASKISIQEIVIRGTVIAIIIVVPSLAVFVLAWVVSDDLLIGAILGAIVHFITMGFSLKISKKILVKK